MRLDSRTKYSLEAGLLTGLIFAMYFGIYSAASFEHAVLVALAVITVAQV